jgi:methylated-DNA-protein-cysteine methyltransferase-like protein
MASDFRARVLAVVRRIPAGRVATYGDVAVLAGTPRAARAVGTVMRTCGALGGYGSFLHVKRDLLRAEGLDVGVSRVRRFAEVRWPAKTALANRLNAGSRFTRGNPRSRTRRLTIQKT